MYGDGGGGRSLHGSAAGSVTQSTWRTPSCQLRPLRPLPQDRARSLSGHKKSVKTRGMQYGPAGRPLCGRPWLAGRADFWVIAPPPHHHHHPPNCILSYLLLSHAIKISRSTWRWHKPAGEKKEKVVRERQEERGKRRERGPLEFFPLLLYSRQVL